jgi:hypothetical protein
METNNFENLLKSKNSIGNLKYVNLIIIITFLISIFFFNNIIKKENSKYLSHGSDQIKILIFYKKLKETNIHNIKKLNIDEYKKINLYYLNNFKNKIIDIKKNIDNKKVLTNKDYNTFKHYQILILNDLKFFNEFYEKK